MHACIKTKFNLGSGSRWARDARTMSSIHKDFSRLKMYGSLREVDSQNRVRSGERLATRGNPLSNLANSRLCLRDARMENKIMS